MLYGAYEIYYDSVLIDTNGKIGNNKVSEGIGNIFHITNLDKDQLRIGKHKIKFDISNYHFSDIKRIGFFQLISQKDIYEKFIAKVKLLISFTSVYAILFITSLVYYFNLQRPKSYLYISIYSFLMLSYLFVTLFWYDYSSNQILIYYGILLQQVIFFASQIMLILFIFNFYEIENKKYHFLSLCIGLFLLEYVYIFGLNTVLFPLFCIFVPLFIAYKSKKRNQYKKLMLSAFFIYNIGVSYFKLIDGIWWIYFTSNALFICLMIVVAIKKWEEEKSKQSDSILKSSRLESQLLKSNIKPHFLMNSLISIQELIYENKEKALDFINSLSEEFYLFSKLSNEKLISIKDEIRICEAHLKIMSYRKAINLKLELEGISGNELVPPAIFHTLIENGITHGFWKKKIGIFKIVKSENLEHVIYHVFNNGDITKAVKRKTSGTGLRYVLSRLEESYTNGWQLYNGPVPGGWETNIHISKSYIEPLLKGNVYENIDS
jgi:sensor histidine kinase YesM